jgi:hypothetical protein
MEGGMTHYINMKLRDIYMEPLHDSIIFLFVILLFVWMMH